mgnify:FL=1
MPDTRIGIVTRLGRTTFELTQRTSAVTLPTFCRCAALLNFSGDRCFKLRPRIGFTISGNALLRHSSTLAGLTIVGAFASSSASNGHIVSRETSRPLPSLLLCRSRRQLGIMIKSFAISAVFGSAMKIAVGHLVCPTRMLSSIPKVMGHVFSHN